MNIFATMYLKLSRNRFRKPFKPLGIKKNRTFLISAPRDISPFIQALAFIAGLRKMGSIVLLTPKNLETIYQFLKPNIFETIFYDKPSIIFSKEYNELKHQLHNKHFHFLIELNKPANISLPYLISAEKRICFYDENNFPYYNIMMKNSVTSLNEFFNIKTTNPQNLFRFYKRSLNKLLKKYNKKSPLLFINGEDYVSWDGDKIIVDENISSSDPQIYEILYFCDAYYGKSDMFYEFAKTFNKRILTS